MVRSAQLLSPVVALLFGLAMLLSPVCFAPVCSAPALADGMKRGTSTDKSPDTVKARTTAKPRLAHSKKSRATAKSRSDKLHASKRRAIAANPPPRPRPGVAVSPPTPSVGDTSSTATPFDVVQLAALRPVFLRPSQPPPTNSSADEIALGARLFSEVKLSADHKMSCATCHEPERAFADGRITARGDKAQALPRNTPALWNLAWQKRFYWDARADSLERQVKDAIEREGEMDSTLQAAAVWLSQDASYVAAFQRTYRADVSTRPELIAQAIAAYQRTLVSPLTRFDRWAAGDDRALAPEELAGLRIFTGKARCLACHGGWRFTDDAVHDIGLRSTDRGASALLGATTAGRAFKTPSLREIDWTGPYMHDGSLMTPDDVLDHYTRRLDRRASLAAELRAPLTLSPAERRDLLAFLRTLSSDRLPTAP